MSDGMRILTEEDIKQSVGYLEDLLNNKVSPRCVYIFYNGAAWADQTIAAKLDKLSLPEPVGYSDRAGRHYFKTLVLTKCLMPDEEFIPLYSHPPMNHILDVGQMVREEKTLDQHRAEFEKWAKSVELPLGRVSSGGLYISNETHFAWQAWKAAKGI